MRSWANGLLLGVLFGAAGCGPSSPAEGTPPTTSTGNPAIPGTASGGVVNVVTASGVEMVALPGGTFSMGTDKGGEDEGPVHAVTVSAFLMDRYEVTQEMFAKAQLPNPSHWQDSPRKPVERLRWRDAKQYCNERSLLEGLKPCYNEKTTDWDVDFSASGYRLPTEAEWEYAARAGGTVPYDFGAPDKLRGFAWFADNAGEQTHAVGGKKPNAWGLHDLFGNVSEWCEDVYSPIYYREKISADPAGPPNPGNDVRRVMRGGSWKASADMCRPTFRQGQRTGDADACFFTDYCGFRCVRRATPEEINRMKAPAR